MISCKTLFEGTRSTKNVFRPYTICAITGSMKVKGLVCFVMMLLGVAAAGAQERVISLADLDRYFQQSEKAYSNSPWSVRTIVEVGETPKGPWEDYSRWSYTVVPPDRTHLVYHSGSKSEFLHIGPLSYRRAEGGTWAISNDAIKGSMTSPTAARRFGDGVLNYTQSRTGNIIAVTVTSRPSADSDPSDTRARIYVVYFSDVDIAGRGMITGEESIVHNGSKWVRTSNIYTFNSNIRIETPEEETARRTEEARVLQLTESLKKRPGEDPLVIVTKPRPGYTHEASANNVQGTVTLNVTFEADGTIGPIEVLKGLEHGLTEATIEAVRKITFTPARHNGKPVSVTRALSYSFRIY